MRKNRLAVLEKFWGKAPEIREVRIEKDGGRAAIAAVVAILLAVGTVIALQWPDLRRYMKIRSM